MSPKINIDVKLAETVPSDDQKSSRLSDARRNNAKQSSDIAQALLQRIKTTFPTVPGKTYKYIDEGWDHEVLIVDDALVFRFPDDEEYRTMLSNEIAVLRRIKPLLTVPVPAYSHIAPDGSFAGYPLLLGEQLTLQRFQSLSAEHTQAFARQLAGFLTTLHTLNLNERLDSQAFPTVAAATMPEDQADLKLQAERQLVGKLTAEEMTDVRAILTGVDDLLGRKLPVVFIHGDIYSNHLLWDKTASRLSVIDFSDMNRSDPAVDFSEIHEYGLDFVQQVYALYDGPKDATFLERAWIYQRWAAVYMMVDYFENHKTSFEVARRTFDRVKNVVGQSDYVSNQ